MLRAIALALRGGPLLPAGPPTPKCFRAKKNATERHGSGTSWSLQIETALSRGLFSQTFRSFSRRGNEHIHKQAVDPFSGQFSNRRAQPFLPPVGNRREVLL